MSNPNVLTANPVNETTYIQVEAVAVEDRNFGSAPPASTNNNFSFINEAGAREFLSANLWPIGMQDVFISNLSKIPLRFFICDDSGSMITSDGHRLITHNGAKRLLSGSRWSELTSALKFHAGIAKAACAPTEFRMLNNSRPIKLGMNDGGDEQRYNEFLEILKQSPNGQTPLCRHIKEVTSIIRSMERELRAANQKVCIIIASDGESTDGDVAQALRPLRDLPAWVVIRLCTDEDRIVNYWNNVDNELELDMDVLDDLCGEAKEVYEANPWLTYGEPLHRLREFGIPVKEIDLLDEVLLSPDQIRLFCSILFGGSVDSYPHPEIDSKGFMQMVKKKNQETSKEWNPIYKTEKPWVDISRLHRATHKGTCLIL